MSKLISHQIVDIVKQALKQVGTDYYKLNTTYELLGIVRERVFCYELYHQMRCQMNAAHKLSLNGEIDKSGHVDFQKKDRKNPDFVFHVPGSHEGNTVVIEVKGKIEPKGILKDFNTILTFIKRYQYKVGIFILYNHSFNELINDLGCELKKLSSNKYASYVHILTIKRAGDACEENFLSEIN